MSEVKTARERIKLVQVEIGAAATALGVGDTLLEYNNMPPGAALIFTSISKGAATDGAVNIGSAANATKYGADLSASAALNPTAPTAAKVVEKGESIIVKVSTAIVGATDANPTYITLAFATL